MYKVGGLIAGKYLVRRVIEGGFGFVYVVSDGSEILVLKTAKGQSLLSADTFRAEATAWIKIGRHPNIVPAFWADEVAGKLFVAAEFVQPDALGRTTLRDYMGGKLRSLQEIVRWSAEFCYGMEHAINRGMRAHRDIKPENLLIGSRQELQISDFGIASAYSARAGANPQQISGTPPYMAPEQWTGGDESVRTDIYAFGVVLHELCFGQLPWNANTVAEFAAAHLHQIVQMPYHPLAKIVEACIAKSPRKRPSGPAELRSRLSDIVKHHNLPLPPAPHVLEHRQEELVALSSLTAAGDLKTALAAARELTHHWPRFAAGWTQLGRVLLETGDVPRARAATEQSLRIDPTRSAPWNNLGLILARHGQHASAVEAFKRAIDADPDNTGAMSNAAEPLRMLGRCGEAIELLLRATKLAPDKYALWTNLGSTFSILQANNEAAQALSRALELAPEDRKLDIAASLSEVQARPMLKVTGSMLLLQGRVSEAVPILKAEAITEPGNAQVAQNYAVALLNIGDLEAAKSAFERLHMLEPQNQFVWMQLMQIASNQGKLDEALRWCDKYAATPGMTARSKAFRAYVLDECGDLQRARSLLLDSMKEHPQEPEIYIAYGDLAVKHGVPQQGIGAYRNAIQRMTAHPSEVERVRETEAKLCRAIAAANRQT